MVIDVEQYRPGDSSLWNSVVSTARNGLFIFDRGFMDYHAHRFVDSSLVVTSQGSVLALMPAHREGDSLVSHGGLTFGGLVLDSGVRAAQVVAVLEAIATDARRLGLQSILYKQVPSIFFSPMSGEDSYALARVGARLVRVDANFVVDLQSRPALQDRRRRAAAKATKLGVSVAESADLALFWASALVPVLEKRHGVSPVHSVAEIEMLHQRFPQRIRLFVASRNGRLLAGVVLFVYNGVTHAQYIAANDEGRETGALDLLFSVLFEDVPGKPRFFSFGVSTEHQGRVLNEGLAEWKEGFGARAWPNSTFEIGL